MRPQSQRPEDERGGGSPLVECLQGPTPAEMVCLPQELACQLPRWHVHLTPTSSSWLNQIERFFALPTEREIRRSVHRGVEELEVAINAFLDQHNADPRPFRWIKSADDILAAVERFCAYNTSST